MKKVKKVLLVWTAFVLIHIAMCTIVPWPIAIAVGHYYGNMEQGLGVYLIMWLCEISIFSFISGYILSRLLGFASGNLVGFFSSPGCLIAVIAYWIPILLGSESMTDKYSVLTMIVFSSLCVLGGSACSHIKTARKLFSRKNGVCQDAHAGQDDLFDFATACKKNVLTEDGFQQSKPNQLL